MTNTRTDRIDNGHRELGLWWMAISPLVWAVHFVACYVTAAIGCQKYARTDDDVSVLAGLAASYTSVAVAMIVWVGVRSYRDHRHGRSSLPHDDDTSEARAQFVGFATFLLSLLSLLATLLTALVFVLAGTCA